MLMFERGSKVRREGVSKTGEYFHSWRHFVLKVHIAVLKCAFTSGRANIPCGTIVTPHHSCPRGTYGPPSPYSSRSCHRLRSTCCLRLPHGAQSGLRSWIRQWNLPVSLTASDTHVEGGRELQLAAPFASAGHTRESPHLVDRTRHFQHLRRSFLL